MSPPASAIRIALSDRYFMFHLALLSQTESTYLLRVVLECQVMQFAICLRAQTALPIFSGPLQALKGLDSVRVELINRMCRSPVRALLLGRSRNFDERRLVQQLRCRFLEKPYDCFTSLAMMSEEGGATNRPDRQIISDLGRVLFNPPSRVAAG